MLFLIKKMDKEGKCSAFQTLFHKRQTEGRVESCFVKANVHTVLCEMIIYIIVFITLTANLASKIRHISGLYV